MKRFLSSITLCVVLIMQPAQADFIGDCSKILNGAQNSFKDLFPTDPQNQFFDIWCFRAYPGGLLAGYTLGNVDFLRGVHVMGGPFEKKTPTFVGTRDEVFALLGIAVDSGGGNAGDALCDTSNTAISEIITRQEGNTIFVTTEGKCVKLPTSDSLCKPPPAVDENGMAKPTNINMLSETNLISYDITGVHIPTLPGFPNPLEFIAQGFTSNICFEHVTEEFTKYDTEIDICFDITDIARDIPGASGNVTMAFKANSTSTIVDDCANTNADNIINLVTGESR